MNADAVEIYEDRIPFLLETSSVKAEAKRGNKRIVNPKFIKKSSFHSL